MNIINEYCKKYFPLILIPIAFLGCTRSADLEWNEESYYKWAEISPGLFGSDGFRMLQERHTNINFINTLTEQEIDENRHYLNGSGVAAGDINGDGLVDLYFAGLGENNKLFKNLGGMKFEDITDQAGVAHEGYYSTGAVFADVNGNGHLDLLVTSMHDEIALYVNDGNANFTRQENSGLGSANGSLTMTLADITGNGYPDLYVTNYKEKSVKDIYTTQQLDWANILYEPLINPDDEYTLIPPFDQHYELIRHDGALTAISELGEVDELYFNRGGSFEKAEQTKNIFLDEYGEPFGLQPDWGLSAKFHDLNNNGLPDLYVCNDFHTPDRIWMNQGDGTFSAASWQTFRNLSYSCMGVDFSDINKNGRLDIFTTEMLDPDHERRLSQAGSEDPDPIRIGEKKNRPIYNRNSLFLQREDHTFAEISYFSGTEATGWSWATRFMDINLNGYEDLIVTTGYLYDILDIDGQFTMMRNRRNLDEHFLEFTKLVNPLHQQNRILKNNGDMTFTDVSSRWGFSELDISHGMAFADLNNNGSLDIIVNRMNDNALIYENRTKSPRIAVRLKGISPNTQAVGAKVELSGGPVHQQKEIAIGGDYVSGSDPLVVFAANLNNDSHEIHIRWPDGSRSLIDGVKANRIYEIDQANAEFLDNYSVERSEPSSPMFTDLSDDLDVIHHEEPFTDFEIQPLLPYRLSQQGPGVAMIDLFQKDKENILMGSGRGGSTTVLNVENSGNFEKLDLEKLSDIAPGDQTSIIGWGEHDYTRVIVGSANYEQGSSNAPSAYSYKVFEDGTIESGSIPGIFSTTGPIAAADINGNGYLDFFIGGSFKPGQYPLDADSRMIRNDQGTLMLDPLNSQTFTDIGLVTGAVFADFNLNGQQDLLISTEWGTLRLFENNNGSFTEVTEEMGLNKWSGWWQGVATGDFTNNGLQDIVATNIGLNTQYQLKNDRPIRIYFDDLDGFGSMDIIEAYSDDSGNYVPRRKLYEFQQQQINLDRSDNHRMFARSTLNEILGDRFDQIAFKEINTLEHTVFINKGDHFEAHPLPAVTQFSAGFHVGVADFDNDGNEDIFISQNFFSVPKDHPRMDAGRGKILLGDGEGNFKPLSGTKSGIKIYGEQRGGAIGDIKQNGKVDLIVSQNGNRLRVFENQVEKSGLRITLRGLPSNRNGVGSTIRLIYENGEKGPTRHIQSGAGHWSQNSLTQVLGFQDSSVAEIEIIWPDNTHQTVPVEESQTNYVIVHPEVDN